jgi:hypothetical protein
MSDRSVYDEETLIELYWGQDMTLEEVSDELECEYSTVVYWMGRYGIERRAAYRLGYTKESEEELSSKYRDR